MARIGLFEDNAAMQKLFEFVAQNAQHEVTTAASLDEARRLLQSVREGTSPPFDFWVIDANLGPYYHGDDARELTTLMGDMCIAGYRIGFSTESMASYEVPVHADVGKNVMKVMNHIRRVELESEATSNLPVAT